MLKGKTRRVVWNQRGSKCVAWLPSWSPGWLGTAAHCLCSKSPESILPNSTSLEKDARSKFEVRFLPNAYCFCITVRLKNCKSNQRKSGIVCTSKQSWIVASHAHPVTSRNILTSHHSDSYKIEIRKCRSGSYIVIWMCTISTVPEEWGRGMKFKWFSAQENLKSYSSYMNELIEFLPNMSYYPYIPVGKLKKIFHAKRIKIQIKNFDPSW